MLSILCETWFDPKPFGGTGQNEIPHEHRGFHVHGIAFCQF